MQIEMDPDQWTVAVDGEEVEMSYKEFCILRELLKAKGRVLTREWLLSRIWEETGSLLHNTRVVDMHVCRLRKKLGAVASRLKTVQCVGYRIANG